MARKVFFSFHYEDVKDFRANTVRNSWLTKGGKAASFSDGSLWERVKTHGDKAIRDLIDSRGLNNTSVTSVLIGTDTHARRWVRYEILKSFERGNGIFGVYINRIRDKNGYRHARGLNPLDRLKIYIDNNGHKIYFYELNNRRWELNRDISSINNKKSNTLYFPEGFWRKNPHWGKSFRLSELFSTYCWDNDSGYYNFPDWVEKAATEAGR